MRNSRDLEAIGGMIAILSVRLDVARHALRQAELAHERARNRRDDAQDQRDRAARGWLAALQSTQPDPVMLSATGTWLVEHEARLRTATLNETIAEQERVVAHGELALRHAEREVTGQIGSRLKREIARRRDERLANDLADHHLRERSV